MDNLRADILATSAYHPGTNIGTVELGDCSAQVAYPSRESNAGVATRTGIELSIESPNSSAVKFFLLVLPQTGPRCLPACEPFHLLPNPRELPSSTYCLFRFPWLLTMRQISEAGFRVAAECFLGECHHVRTRRKMSIDRCF